MAVHAFVVSVRLNRLYARPAPCTVMMRAPIEKSVRWSGLCSLRFRLHCANALPAATSIVSCGPRSSSEAKSTAYDTDIVDPLVVSGSVTLRAALAVARASSARKRSGCSKAACGRPMNNRPAPTTITAVT